MKVYNIKIKNRILPAVCALILAVVHLITLVPVMAAVTTGGNTYPLQVYGTGESGLMIREEPSLDSTGSIVMPEGTIFTVYGLWSDPPEGFVGINYNGAYGYVRLRYTKADPSAGSFPVRSPSSGYITPTWYTVINTAGEGLELRGAPTPDTYTFGPLYDGSQILVEATQDGWAYGNFNGQMGWVYTGYLTESPVQSGNAQGDYSETNQNQSVPVHSLEGYSYDQADINAFYPDGFASGTRLQDSDWYAYFLQIADEKGYADVNPAAKKHSFGTPPESWAPRSGVVGADIVDMDLDDTEDMILYYFAEEMDLDNVISDRSCLYARLYRKGPDGTVQCLQPLPLVSLSSHFSSMECTIGIMRINGVPFLYKEDYWTALDAAMQPSQQYYWYGCKNGALQMRWSIEALNKRPDTDISYYFYNYQQSETGERQLLWGSESAGEEPAETPLLDSSVSRAEVLRKGSELIGIPVNQYELRIDSDSSMNSTGINQETGHWWGTSLVKPSIEIKISGNNNDNQGMDLVVSIDITDDVKP